MKWSRGAIRMARAASHAAAVDRQIHLHEPRLGEVAGFVVADSGPGSASRSMSGTAHVRGRRVGEVAESVEIRG